MKLCIFGAGGCMGRTVARLASEADDITIVGAVDDHRSPHIGRDVGELAGTIHAGVAISADASSALLGADVLIDFTVAAAFTPMLRTAMQAGVAVVSGTTGLSDAQRTLIEQASTKVPVLWSPNMSVGIQVLARIVEQAVAALSDYDVEIVETHHQRKVDAPSGTAVLLQQAAQAARPELVPVYGREGVPGARAPNEIGMHALRGGGVVGDHSVHLVGPFDRIEISHRAMSRELFASGAMRAARFVCGKLAGRYQLSDLL
jgi:4-hydroxy-tetrahydrodipicolinate reductase